MFGANISDFLQNMFDRIENEIGHEITFTDRFRLAQYEKSDGLCYVVGEISKNLDFFIDTGDSKMHFIQNGDLFKLDELDIEKPFWGIEKISTPNLMSGRCEHKLYYCSPEN